MKASLKFREEQKPVFRAKVPLSILGLPFQSGIVAGESKDLSLNLSTFFESGPSIKIAYRPNDTWNPFSLIVKTGTGPFGSPINSSMLMSAEFNLIGKGNPSFMLHFKPQFGDFSIKKSQSSVFDNVMMMKNGAVLEENESSSSIEVIETPTVVGVNGNIYSPEKRKITLLPSKVAGDLFSGVEFAARTALPVRGNAVVNFRWGVRVPAEMEMMKKSGESMAGIGFKKIPFLVMNKIGIEHVDGEDSKRAAAAATGRPDLSSVRDGDVAEACFNVKRQLEILQTENGLLKRAVEDLRQEIRVGDLNSSGKYREIERNKNDKIERRNNEKKSTESDVNQELKKALKGASTGA